MFPSPRSLVLSAFSAMALLTLSEVAAAASSTCRFVPIPGNCETGSVAANRSGHFIFFEVSPNANYRVWDDTTKVTVASGTAGWRGHRKTIFGLYGSNYKLRVDNPLGGIAYISNQ